MRWKRAPSVGLECSQENSGALQLLERDAAFQRAVEMAPDVAVIFGEQFGEVRIEFGEFEVSMRPSGVSANFPPALSVTMPQVESARSRR